MPDPTQFAEGVAMEPCECGCGYDVPDWPEDMQYAFHAGREVGQAEATARERQRIRQSSRLCNDGTEYSVAADLLDGDGDA